MSDEPGAVKRQVHLVRITPLSKLLIGDDSGLGNYQQTLDYIPGSIVRGAVAEVLLKYNPNSKTRDYCQVFEHTQPPIFSHCYPGRSRTARVFPFPLTGRTCKHYPHYPRPKPKSGDRPRHSVFDTLISQFVYELVSDPEFPNRSNLLPELGKDWAKIQTCYDPSCPTCQGPVIPSEGYYQLDRDDHPGLAAEVQISRATHVGINRARGVAEEALLFTQETIEPMGEDGSIYFIGQAVLHPDYLVKDAELRQELLPGLREVRSIGRGRSRGLGKVRIDVIPLPTENKKEELKKKLGKFNREIHQRLQTYVADDERLTLADGTFFTLTLRSEAIFTGELCQPVLWPLRMEQTLSSQFALYRLRSWARTKIIGGWDNANRMPRRTQLTVQRGSVYLYFTPELDQETIASTLVKLETSGIGKERERGYGQVTVCAPFHLQPVSAVVEKSVQLLPDLPRQEIARRMLESAQRGETTGLSWMAEQTLKAVIHDPDLPDKILLLKSTQAQLLLRVASQTASIEEVMLWIRVQMGRQPEQWGADQLGERVLKDLAKLRDAEDPIAAVRGYAGQFYRWVVALRGEKGSEEENDE